MTSFIEIVTGQHGQMKEGLIKFRLLDYIIIEGLNSSFSFIFVFSYRKFK